jgi:DnaJ homolog subfamily C member 28
VTKSPGDEGPARRPATDGPWEHLGSVRETLIDRQIREAVEAGSFDNLPHQGEPLPNDENPHAGDWGLAFHMLRNAGFAPPWIEADKAVRALLARRDAILGRAAEGPPPSEIARRRDLRTLEQLVAEINASIAQVNAAAPSSRQQRQPLVLAAELARYDAACSR